MVTYVTAFYPVRTDLDLTSYWTDFGRLAESGVPILLFVDPTMVVGPLPRTVYVLRRRLPPPPIAREDAILPAHRTPEKDTFEFFCLMLQKLFFVSEALAYSEASHLAWIDFRLFHVVRDVPRVQEALRRMASSSPRILAPGCWSPQSSVSWDAICWRYCGGFLLGPRACFPQAYARQCELVRQGLPHLTWEVNYWARMEDVFEWYAADHDDRMLLSVPEVASTKPS